MGSKIHGKNCFLEAATNDFSGDGSKADLNVDVALAETGAFTDSWMSYVEGLANWTLEFGGYYIDGAGNLADLAFAMLQAGVQALKFAPGGNVVGNLQYAGSAILKTMKAGNTLAAAVTLNLSFQGSGALTLTAITS